MHMQLGKASLLKYLFQNSDPERTKNMPRRKLEVNSYHVLELQAKPTLPETSALG